MLKQLLCLILLGGVVTACTMATPTPPKPLVTPTPTELLPVAPTPNGYRQPELANITIPVEEIVTLLPRDAIPAILPDQLPEMMVSASQATDLSPNLPVMGVSINGKSHAYPIPFLSHHEIINTTLGGRKIAATW